MDARAIVEAVICSGKSLTVDDSKTLIQKACSALGVDLDNLHEAAEKRKLSKLFSIMDNISHLLQSVLANQRSTYGLKLIMTKYSTERPLSHQIIPLSAKFIYLI